jgi:elongation factor Ts
VNKDLPPQVGVLVATDAKGAEVARDIATHVAAFSPTYLTRDEVPAETVENERRIAEETARNEGKPEAALPKIVEGRLNGYFKDVVLLDQPFAKDPKKSIAQVLAEVGGTVTGFVRFRVGA